jgi:hypothetical protein
MPHDVLQPLKPTRHLKYAIITPYRYLIVVIFVARKFSDAFSLNQHLYSVERRADTLMMNLKGHGRSRSWPTLEVLSQHLPELTEENHEKPQSV